MITKIICKDCNKEHEYEMSDKATMKKIYCPSCSKIRYEKCVEISNRFKLTGGKIGRPENSYKIPEKKKPTFNEGCMVWDESCILGY